MPNATVPKLARPVRAACPVVPCRALSVVSLLCSLNRFHPCAFLPLSIPAALPVRFATGRAYQATAQWILLCCTLRIYWFSPSHLLRTHHAYTIWTAHTYTEKRTCPTPDNPGEKGGVLRVLFFNPPWSTHLSPLVPSVQLTVLSMEPHLDAGFFLSRALCLSVSVLLFLFVYFRLGEQWAE